MEWHQDNMCTEMWEMKYSNIFVNTKKVKLYLLLLKKNMFINYILSAFNQMFEKKNIFI